jgi:Tlde1 domain
MLLGFALKSAGTQAGPAETDVPAPRMSVFGTIHPEIFRLSAPLGSDSPAERVRLASLEPLVGFDALTNGRGTLAEASAPTCRNAPFEERFAALEDHAAPFDKRFASTDDCPSSFDASLASAMEVLANSLRLPADPEVPKKRADAPKPTLFKSLVHLGQPRKDAPLTEDDGRTAIYDITARTVYLPSGRRLEAHSGLGGFMDSPRHVHLRMRGATPPNLYTLTLRERMFHGVRAIRLNPIDDNRMYGRAGILAHSYMLGPNGQSNGCVSFGNYPEFLNAFLRGEVTRLAVVERLESPPGRLAAGQLPEPVRALLASTDRRRQYAAAGEHDASPQPEFSGAKSGLDAGLVPANVQSSSGW